MIARTLMVGIDEAPPAPMQLGDPATGDFRGYEVDLLKEVANRLGVQFGFRRALWSVIISQLISGQVDLLCSAATVAPQREEVVQFCTPHLEVSLAIVKRADIPLEKGIASLRVGVRRGTTAEAYVKEQTRIVPAQLSESNEELYRLLAECRLDAVVDDSPIANWFSQSVPGLGPVQLIGGTEGAYAIMVRRGNERLRTEINDALDMMNEDGTRQKILRKWFGNE